MATEFIPFEESTISAGVKAFSQRAASQRASLFPDTWLVHKHGGAGAGGRDRLILAISGSAVQCGKATGAGRIRN